MVSTHVASFNNKILYASTHSIDATKDDGRYGRMVNHSRKSPNATPKVFTDDIGIPRLCLVANREGELVYDYGERRGDIMKSNPWLDT